MTLDTPTRLDSAQELAVGTDSRSRCSVIVICTKDRPDEIAASCIAAHSASPSVPILVIDASTTEATRDACDQLSHEYGESFDLLYRRARQPGLARQRNEAVGICRQLGVEVVHFIDDDTEVMSGYFDAIEHRFRQDATVMGLGGIILNQPEVNFLAVKSFFMLVSRRRGAVLRSGRNMPGQYPGTQASDPVDWLNGCSMSFRLAVFDEILFDSALRGYSMGEDYDFTFRVSRQHKLAVEPSATCIHHMTPTMRGSARTSSRQCIEATHRWVKAHKHFGMSTTAFWWSTLGDFLLRTAYGAIRMKSEPFQEALGILDGVGTIVGDRIQLGRSETRC